MAAGFHVVANKRFAEFANNLQREIEQLLDAQAPTISPSSKSVITVIIGNAFDKAENDGYQGATIGIETIADRPYTETITEEKTFTCKQAAEIMGICKPKGYTKKGTFSGVGFGDKDESGE